MCNTFILQFMNREVGKKKVENLKTLSLNEKCYRPNIRYAHTQVYESINLIFKMHF